MKTKTPFFLTEQINFPHASSGGFPLRGLLRSYLLHLIPVSPIHSECMELIFNQIGFSSSQKLLMIHFQGAGPSETLSRLETAEDVNDLLRWLRDHMERIHTSRLEAALRETLRTALRCVHKTGSFRGAAYRRRLAILRERLALEPPAIHLLEFAACYQLSSPFMQYCDQYFASDWPLLMSRALNIPHRTLLDHLKGEHGLIQKVLMEITLNKMVVYEPLLHYLIGLRADFIDPNICMPAPTSPYPLNSFPVPAESLDLIQRMLSIPGGQHILFYGRPGTGKTELAKALAHGHGFHPLLLSCGKTGSQQDRRLAITAALAMATPKTLLIVDEADNLLNSRFGFDESQVDKSWINTFMDTCPVNMIWITNEFDEIPASVLRRFAYSLHFKKFTHQQRLSAWEIHLSRQKLRSQLSRGSVERLARKYETDAGAIASAVEVTQKLYQGTRPNAGELESKLELLLSHHTRLSGIREPKHKSRRNEPVYDPNALHTDVDTQQVLRSLQHHCARDRSPVESPPATLLLWGLPGTGKTEFATYLARELDRVLIRKRISDLQSKYVGETEQRIAAAFQEAEAAHAVLVLDEADSLFLDRTTNTRSWESSQTNEVLTQMENFEGICICCTNLLSHLDRAALRRFTWKIEFKPLREEGRERLYRRYFQPKGRLSQEVITRLAHMNRLTPGDFNVVRQQFVFSGRTPKTRALLDALQREQQYKAGKGGSLIGF
jgi:SpoVK/Ycf46/Vps4 family AAA+-type ATPase